MTKFNDGSFKVGDDFPLETLKDGKDIKSTILSFTEDSITVLTENGQTVVLKNVSLH